MERQGVITSVEKQKKQQHRYNVFIDDEFAFAVHEDVLMRHRLFKGQSVPPERLEEVLRDEERQDAYVKAVKWLGSRPRTEKEIRGYLTRKEYEPSAIDDCLKRLTEQRYVDDERFSRSLAEERLQRHGKGKQWIKQELLQKGVDKSTVQEAVGAIDPEDECASATAIARKRWKTLSGQEDRAGAKRKLYAYLARRGFSSAAVREAVREATADEPAGAEEEDWTWE